MTHQFWINVASAISLFGAAAVWIWVWAHWGPCARQTFGQGTPILNILIRTEGIHRADGETLQRPPPLALGQACSKEITMRSRSLLIAALAAAALFMSLSVC